MTLSLIAGLPSSTLLLSRFDVTPLSVSPSLSGVSSVRTICAPLIFSPAFFTLYPSAVVSVISVVSFTFEKETSDVFFFSGLSPDNGK